MNPENPRGKEVYSKPILDRNDDKWEFWDKQNKKIKKNRSEIHTASLLVSSQEELKQSGVSTFYKKSWGGKIIKFYLNASSLKQ